MESKIEIKQIRVVEFALNQSQEPIVKGTPIQYNVSIQHRAKPKEDNILVLVKIDILREKQQSPLCHALISLSFFLSNMSQMLCNKELQMPSTIVDILNSVSLSTCRGVLWSRLQGTSLGNIVMPIVDMKTLINAKETKKRKNTIKKVPIITKK